MKLAKRSVHAVLVAVTFASMFAGIPARAGSLDDHPFVFPVARTVPCGVVACGAPCGYSCDAAEANSNLCEKPFNSVSYVDVVTDPAPSIDHGKVMLVIETRPRYSWSTFLCELKSDGGHNGARISAEHLPDGPCKFTSPPSPIPDHEATWGLWYECPKYQVAEVTPGRRYVIRGYNVADAFDCPGSYRFEFVPDAS